MPHGTCATFAADAVLGYTDGYMSFAQQVTNFEDPAPAEFNDPNNKGVPRKAVLIRNLMLACDKLMSSITHFYHLGALSYIQGPAMPPWTPFFNDGYYNTLLLNTTNKMLPVRRAAPEGYSDTLWDAVITQYVKALRIRRLVFQASALFAGRTPHTSALVAGGVTTKASEDLAEKCATFKKILEDEVEPFIRTEYVPLALALSALYPTWDNDRTVGTPANGYGAGLGQFLSWGGYPNLDGSVALPGGYMTVNDTEDVPLITGIGNLGTAIAAVEAELKESIANTRTANYNDEFDANLEAFPGDVTRTQPDRELGYSWGKAPRFAGKAREVGPMARMYVGGFFDYGVNMLAALDTAGIPASATYTTTTTGAGEYFGLAPSAVERDLAVALLRDGLATVSVETVGADLDYAAVAALIPGTFPTLEALLDAVYNDATTAITGTVLTHIAGLVCGLSTMDRIRARAIESLYLILNVLALAPAGSGVTAAGWINQLEEIAATGEPTCRQLPTPLAERKGFGCVEAPRGSLSHHSTIQNGKITAYQCVVPYTWNISPRDIHGNEGPTEAAMVGIPYLALNTSYAPVVAQGNVSTVGSVEALRVAQSFDPCVACAVH